MKYVIPLVLACLLMSCDKDFKAPEPEHLIEQNVMEDILYDIKLLKAAKSKNYRILKDNNVKIDTYIYKKYKTDSITLRENIAYYATASFKTFKEIEDNVKQRFIAEQEKLGVKSKKTSLEEKKSPVLEVVEHVVDPAQNLLLSEDFKRWRAVNSSLFLSDEEFGDREVLKLVADTQISQHRIDIPVEKLNGRYEFSVLAKKGEMNIVRLRIGSQGYGVIFNLKSGTVENVQPNDVASITKVKNGWYKCTITCAVRNVTIARVNVFNTTSFSDYSGDDLKGVFVSNPKLVKVASR
ncbi:MAG: DUF4296 domain-containing protein [Flavobacteriaceae bacterium]